MTHISPKDIKQNDIIFYYLESKGWTTAAILKVSPKHVGETFILTSFAIRYDRSRLGIKKIEKTINYTDSAFPIGHSYIFPNKVLIFKLDKNEAMFNLSEIM